MPMKTALDVIKRIQWDEMMPPESFTIGYLDRFTGLVEDEFSKFSNWGNLVSLKSFIEMALVKSKNISKGSLDSIPSPSVKIQIICRKFCLMFKCKTLLGVVKKLLKTKSLLTSPSNVLPLHLKQTFPPII